MLYCPSCKKIVNNAEAVNYVYGSDADGNRGMDCTDYVCPECGCELEERNVFSEKEFKSILRNASEKELLSFLEDMLLNSDDRKEEIIDILYNYHEDCLEEDRNIDLLPSSCIID